MINRTNTKIEVLFFYMKKSVKLKLKMHIYLTNVLNVTTILRKQIHNSFTETNVYMQIAYIFFWRKQTVHYFF